ncbi:MAG: glycoside hydrolase family 2 TIM barrel-domain containing protein [Bacteroidota bacterium]
MKTLMLSLLLVPLMAVAQQQPIKVEIRQETNGKWQLYRGGQPYYIKGVGGQVYLDRAVEYGANSVRTWGVNDAVKVLDEAHEKGLSVLFGLWVGQERQGFDYNDGKAVKAQLARFTEVVRKYKDHPAVLMWGIGNENDLFYSDLRVWDAINDIAKMIHEEDPNHPTMHVTAGIDVAEIQLIRERAPHIDIMGFNTYGDILGLDQQIRSYGWEGAYLISEWGPTGHWEVPKTEWGAPIEQTSTEKAASFKQRYEEMIAYDSEKCIGSYAFIWGNKQETTPTWYGIFTSQGDESEISDMLQKLWSGRFPENRAPSISSLKIDGKAAIENAYVIPNGKHTIVADVTDADGDDLTYEWVILKSEFGLTGTGGDAEVKPDAVPITPIGNPEIATRDNPLEKYSFFTRNTGTLEFKAPKKTGAYRFFVYAYDGQGNVATGNIPFFVR